MLESMRKYQSSVFIYVVFGLLILVFGVNFGPGSSGCNPTKGGDFAAKVNGEIIPREEWARMYSQQVEMYKRMMGGRADLDEAFLERLGVRQNVLNNLISARLVAQEARDRGVYITDDELTTHIANTYGVKGITAEQYNLSVTKQFGVSVERFEEQVRSQLAAQKLMQMVTEAVDISDAEVRATFDKEHDRVMANFVKFDPDSLSKPTIDNAVVDAFIVSNAKDIEERYEKDQSKYNTPRMMRVRQIVKNLAPDASDAEVAKARGELDDLKHQIEGGADFAALAKAHNDDEGSKAAGGDLGFVSAGQLVRPVDEAIASLEVNKLSDPVRTPRGLALLQVTEVKNAARKPFDDVKKDIARSILAERAMDEQAKSQAKAFLAKLKGGSSLESLTVSEADARDEVVKMAKNVIAKPTRFETPWILRTQEAIPRIGVSPELHEAVFALEKDKPIAPDVFKVGRSYYVVTYKDRERPDDATFAATQDGLRRDALSEKKDRVARDWLDHLREKARIMINPQIAPERSAES